MVAIYLNPVLKAIVQVIEETAELSCKPHKPRKKTNNIAMGDISSIIEMKGKQGQGSVSVSFPNIVVDSLSRSMFQSDESLSDEDKKDLVGELANMIAGRVKGELGSRRLQLSISTPEILTGRPHRINHTGDAPVFLLAFFTAVGPFYVELSFAEH